jgi:ferredoxin/flavodoxin
MNTTIYYFSGTGNSLKVAKDIAAGLQSAEFFKICKNNIGIKNTTSNNIGIVFPVYVSGMPFLVKEFIEKLRIKKEVYVFTVATFGVSAGASIAQLEKLLVHKGIKLSAAFKMQMPGNYQVMYPPFSEKKQLEFFKNEEESIAKIVSAINNKKIVKCSGIGNVIMKAVGGLMYKSFNPNEKDKNFWTDDKCNGCGICLQVCPANNIKMQEGTPEWQHKCEQCVACMQWCPQKSIQYKKVTVKRGRYNHPDIKAKDLFHL